MVLTKEDLKEQTKELKNTITAILTTQNEQISQLQNAINHLHEKVAESRAAPKKAATKKATKTADEGASEKKPATKTAAKGKAPIMSAWFKNKMKDNADFAKDFVERKPIADLCEEKKLNTKKLTGPTINKLWTAFNTAGKTKASDNPEIAKVYTEFNEKYNEETK